MPRLNRVGSNFMDISIILPIYNAAKWLDDCFDSIIQQKVNGKFEVSVFNDGSTDNSLDLCLKWRSKLMEKGISMILDGHAEEKPKGVGFAKNKAVYQSNGEYICFLDADDIMVCDRLQKQWEVAQKHQNALIGCKFSRIPDDSTVRYTKWANSLNLEQLYTQIYTSHGPTLIMPTWFCHRNVFLQVKSFTEEGKGVPEDLLFFYAHLDNGGKLHRVDHSLLKYRYHPEATTFTVSEETIWKVRLSYFEKKILNSWSSFTIWNAGKEGRRFYRSLSEENKAKVLSFCDVDKKKINKRFYIYEESKLLNKPKVPIIHFKEVKPPLVICVKLDLTKGNFENNLASLNLKEGIDYYHFA